MKKLMKIVRLKILLSLVLAVRGGSEKCHPENSVCVTSQKQNATELPVLHVRLASFEDAAKVLAGLNGSYQAWVTREEVKMDLKGNGGSVVTEKEKCRMEEGQRTPGWVKRLIFRLFFAPLERKPHLFVMTSCRLTRRLL